MDHFVGRPKLGFHAHVSVDISVTSPSHSLHIRSWFNTGSLLGVFFEDPWELVAAREEFPAAQLYLAEGSGFGDAGAADLRSQEVDDPFPWPRDVPG